MRRNHYFLCFILSVVTWIGILNFLFTNKSNSHIYSSESDIKENLDKFEETVDGEIKKSEFVINKLKTVVENKIEPVPVPNAIQEVFGQRVQNKFDNQINKENGGNALLISKSMSKASYPNEKKEVKIPHTESAIAIILFACNRVTVSRCLDQLIRYRPSKEQFPIIVSQDCGSVSTADVIKSYGDKVFHIMQPDQQDIPVPPKEKKFKGYFKIARHYGWALNQTFVKYGFNTAIIVEDDLDISSDFYDYFEATLPILKQDPTLWCVSAWNDNGKMPLIDLSAGDLLYRTDFFPGLGWMLTKSLWSELMVKWPHSYWDDWIRQPEQRKERACIRPELSRTKTFGKIGVSNGLFYEKHLKYIYLNEKYVDFRKKNLTYLLKTNYDKNFLNIVNSSPVVGYMELKSGKVHFDGSVRIVYSSRDNYKRICKSLGLMDDFKSGVPRTGYLGIVSFVYYNRRVFLVPDDSWKGYDLTW